MIETYWFNWSSHIYYSTTAFSKGVVRGRRISLCHPRPLALRIKDKAFWSCVISLCLHPISQATLPSSLPFGTTFRYSRTYVFSTPELSCMLFPFPGMCCLTNQLNLSSAGKPFLIPRPSGPLSPRSCSHCSSSPPQTWHNCILTCGNFVSFLFFH